MKTSPQGDDPWVPNRILVEVQLLSIGVQFILMTFFEDSTDMTDIVLAVLGRHEDVVE